MWSPLGHELVCGESHCYWHPRAWTPEYRVKGSVLSLPLPQHHPGDAQWLVHLWSYLERDAPRVPRSRGLHWVLRASRVKSYKKSVSQTFQALSQAHITPNFPSTFRAPYPSTFHALIPSNFPRTFHAHIPPNFPRPFPSPHPHTFHRPL